MGKLKDNNLGFTLIELLVVVAIIGILAAIAIPQFQSYRTRAYDARALSDAKNLISAQEVYYVDTERYTDDITLLDSFEQTSSGVVVQLFNSFGSDDIYGVMTYHSQGSNTYCYISDDDSKIRTVSGSPSALGDCIY